MLREKPRNKKKTQQKKTVDESLIKQANNRLKPSKVNWMKIDADLQKTHTHTTIHIA